MNTFGTFKEPHRRENASNASNEYSDFGVGGLGVRVPVTAGSDGSDSKWEGGSGDVRSMTGIWRMKNAR